MPDIKYVDSQSTNIHSFGYDEPTQTLAIRFRKSGGEIASTYHYSGVPKSVFEEMQKADSHGSFFHLSVRGKYTHAKQ